MSAMVSEVVIQEVKRRRDAGEPLAVLARELGVTWQRLWGMLKVLATTAPATPLPEVRSVGDGPLSERYRPRTLAAMWGQDEVVRVLRRLAADPHPCAFLFEGETGTGKTSAALALANELGCDVGAEEWGGVWQIASGEQSADAVREVGRRMCLTVPKGSGWKVFIVNEADRMSRPAEVIWLDLLERLPRKTVVVFTTNDARSLSARFRDRCARLAFEAGALVLGPAARALVAQVWKAETGKPADRATVETIVEVATEDGSLSFRRLLQVTERHLMKRSQN